MPSNEGLPPEEMETLKMFCKSCKEFTEVRGVYDSVEAWTLVRADYGNGRVNVELGQMIGESEICGVRDFTCMECHEPVMENGEHSQYVESEERLLEIIDHQFMD